MDLDEALVVQGRSALIPAFVEVYAPRLRAFEAGSPTCEGERRAALGGFERVSDWIATFEAELSPPSPDEESPR